mgnify:CR=1 FL=1
MPLIFAQNELNASGINYADVTGVRYQYPKRMYKNVIKTGERFIYYRGRKTAESNRAPQVYFGTGIVGDIYEDETNETRLICDVLDYKSFETPVPFKLGNNDYLEEGGRRKGYFQAGVRRITEREFQRILSLAEVSLHGNDEIEDKKYRRLGQMYASAEVARKVDEYAIEVAKNYLSEKWPRSEIEVMAHNNPGFDILVRNDQESVFVEVKGTQRLLPQFFMSDGELKFSVANAEKYMLLVVHEIDLEKSQHRIFTRDGEINANFFDLTPIQWSIVAKV